MRISRPSQFFKALGLTAALPISASLLMISMGKALASGQFSKTCDNIETDEPVYLVADCRTRNGSVNYTSIDLNDYITNDNGHLRWASHGDFEKTCYIIGVYENTMGARCRARNGQYVEDNIDLDKHIANINGVLTYEK